MSFMNIGDRKEMKGFVTSEKYLLNQTLPEIEKRLGFHEGRLSEGATFLVAERIPQKGEFETRGYSQVAGHNHVSLDKQINTSGHPLEGYNKDALLSQAQKAMSEDRLIKVVPKTAHNPEMDNDRQYPPGSGIPQWEVTSEIPFKVESIIEPNGKYVGQVKDNSPQSQSTGNTNQSSSNKSSANMENNEEKSPRDIRNMKSGELSPYFNKLSSKDNTANNSVKSDGKGNEETDSSQDQTTKNLATSKYFSANKNDMVNTGGKDESKGKKDESQGEGSSGKGNMGAGAAAGPAPGSENKASKFYNPDYEQSPPPKPERPENTPPKQKGPQP